MKPVSPVLLDQPETQSLEIKIAEHQAEHLPLPALLVNDRTKQYTNTLKEADYIITRWELSDEDIARIIVTKSIWFYQWNLRRLVAPILLDASPPLTTQSVEP